MRTALHLALLQAIFLSACSAKREATPEARLLEDKIRAADKQIEELDGKIREIEFDQGLKIKLSHEKDLLQSRRGRLFERLRIESERSGVPSQLAAPGPVAPPSGGGGGHH